MRMIEGTFFVYLFYFLSFAKYHVILFVQVPYSKLEVHRVIWLAFNFGCSYELPYSWGWCPRSLVLVLGPSTIPFMFSVGLFRHVQTSLFDMIGEEDHLTKM